MGSCLPLLGAMVYYKSSFWPRSNHGAEMIRLHRLIARPVVMGIIMPLVFSGCVQNSRTKKSSDNSTTPYLTKTTHLIGIMASPQPPRVGGHIPTIQEGPIERVVAASVANGKDGLILWAKTGFETTGPIADALTVRGPGGGKWNAMVFLTLVAPSVIVGGIGGGVVGATQGALEEISRLKTEDSLEPADVLPQETLRKAIQESNIQELIRDDVVEIAQGTKTSSVVSAQCYPSASSYACSPFDVLVRTQVLHMGFEKRTIEADPKFIFSMTVQADLLQAMDLKIIGSKKFQILSDDQTLSQWAEEDARLFRGTVSISCRKAAKLIVDEFLKR